MKQADKAREFAAKAHEGQTYGPNEPYTAHLEAVASLVGDDDTARAIAYLHDVVEDTPVTLSEVELHFGSLIADCVGLLTDGPGINRKERKAATHAKLAKVEAPHYLALVVKAADRTANVEACVEKQNTALLQMYKREQLAFWAAAYRPNLCDHLWDRIGKALSA